MKSFNLEEAISITEEYGALLVQKSLRSGQSIIHEGSVVVIGDVNPGAEVISGGNIVIMGALRGVAHAGNNGNTEAVVIAFRLQPTQLRIADYITRSPDADSDEAEYPEIARVVGKSITIETLKLT